MNDCDSRVEALITEVSKVQVDCCKTAEVKDRVVYSQGPWTTVFRSFFPKKNQDHKHDDIPNDGKVYEHSHECLKCRKTFSHAHKKHRVWVSERFPHHCKECKDSFNKEKPGTGNHADEGDVIVECSAKFQYEDPETRNIIHIRRKTKDHRPIRVEVADNASEETRKIAFRNVVVVYREKYSNKKELILTENGSTVSMTFGEFKTLVNGIDDSRFNRRELADYVLERAQHSKICEGRTKCKTCVFANTRYRDKRPRVIKEIPLTPASKRFVKAQKVAKNQAPEDSKKVGLSIDEEHEQMYGIGAIIRRSLEESNRDVTGKFSRALGLPSENGYREEVVAQGPDPWAFLNREEVAAQGPDPWAFLKEPVGKPGVATWDPHNAGRDHMMYRPNSIQAAALAKEHEDFARTFDHMRSTEAFSYTPQRFEARPAVQSCVPVCSEADLKTESIQKWGGYYHPVTLQWIDAVVEYVDESGKELPTEEEWYKAEQEAVTIRFKKVGKEMHVTGSSECEAAEKAVEDSENQLREAIVLAMDQVDGTDSMGYQFDEVAPPEWRSPPNAGFTLGNVPVAEAQGPKIVPASCNTVDKIAGLLNARDISDPNVSSLGSAEDWDYIENGGVLLNDQLPESSLKPGNTMKQQTSDCEAHAGETRHVGDVIDDCGMVHLLLDDNTLMGFAENAYCVITPRHNSNLIVGKLVGVSQADRSFLAYVERVDLLAGDLQRVILANHKLRFVSELPVPLGEGMVHFHKGTTRFRPLAIVDYNSNQHYTHGNNYWYLANGLRYMCDVGPGDSGAVVVKDRTIIGMHVCGDVSGTFGVASEYPPKLFSSEMFVAHGREGETIAIQDHHHKDIPDDGEKHSHVHQCLSCNELFAHTHKKHPFEVSKRYLHACRRCKIRADKPTVSEEPYLDEDESGIGVITTNVESIASNSNPKVTWYGGKRILIEISDKWEDEIAITPIRTAGARVVVNPFDEEELSSRLPQRFLEAQEIARPQGSQLMQVRQFEAPICEPFEKIQTSLSGAENSSIPFCYFVGLALNVCPAFVDKIGKVDGLSERDCKFECPLGVLSRICHHRLSQQVYHEYVRDVTGFYCGEILLEEFIAAFNNAKKSGATPLNILNDLTEDHLIVCCIIDRDIKKFREEFPFHMKLTPYKYVKPVSVRIPKYGSHATRGLMYGHDGFNMTTTCECDQNVLDDYKYVLMRPDCPGGFNRGHFAGYSVQYRMGQYPMMCRETRLQIGSVKSGVDLDGFVENLRGYPGMTQVPREALKGYYFQNIPWDDSNLRCAAF